MAWCWQQTALSLILYLAALTTIPTELLEAASIDGANAWQQFRRIMVPLLRPASVVVISLAVINTLKGFDIVYVLTKGGPFHTSDNLAMFMFSETFFKYQFGLRGCHRYRPLRPGHHRDRHLLPAEPRFGAHSMADPESRRSVPDPGASRLLLHGFILAVLVVYAAPIIGIVLTSLQTDAEIFSTRRVAHP